MDYIIWKDKKKFQGQEGNQLEIILKKGKKKNETTEKGILDHGA